MPGYGFEGLLAATAARRSPELGAPPPVDPAAPLINRAAIRASDMRARPASPGLATDIDFGAALESQPTDMGTYVSPSQVSENRSIAARGAFEASPEWGGVGGGLRSAAQMEQDLKARGLLNATYGQGVAQNNLEEDVRGDAMTNAIQARRKTLGYEDLMPADSRPRVVLGGRDYAGSESSEPGMPTAGEYRQNRSLIAQAAAKQNPKDVAEGAATMGRGRLAEELAMLRDQLADEVRNGRRTQEDADAAFSRAAQQAQELAEILKGGFPRSEMVGP